MFLVKLQDAEKFYLESCDPVRFSDRYAAKKYRTLRDALNEATEKLKNYRWAVEERRPDGTVLERGEEKC